MRVMLIHPGHTFATSDVYDGLKWGLEANGIEVVGFRWGQTLQILNATAQGAVHAGLVQPGQPAEQFVEFAGFLASADAVSIAVEQEVDAALVVNGLLFPPKRALILQQLGIPVACYGTEAPYFWEMERQIAPAYTHWFTQERRCAKWFDSLLPGRAHYLPMAYNPAVHRPGPTDPERAADVVFVGGGYPERKALLAGADWRGVRLETRGTLWHLDLEAEREAEDVGSGRRYSEGAIPNSETASWHRSSAIALNLNRNMTYIETGGSIAPGEAESLGPRAYEIPAVGGFMLSDDERPELVEVYGDTVPTFRAGNPGDLSRQVRHWLTHPDARQRQRVAQYEAVQPHHWGARAAQLLSIIT